jgi:hypothetical protein
MKNSSANTFYLFLAAGLVLAFLWFAGMNDWIDLGALSGKCPPGSSEITGQSHGRRTHLCVTQR